MSADPGLRPGDLRPEDLLDPAGGEVVTRVPVREVDLPHHAGTMALLTLDNGRDSTRPTTLGPGGLLNLRAALDDVAARVAAGTVVAVGVTGTPSVFAAGADLKDVVRITSPAQARGVAALGHAALRRLGELGVPSFAFVNGVALGGGLEVALHCSYRTVATTARLALPEVALGLVPGWGGTQLLPSLVGIATALRVVLVDPAAGRQLDAATAVDLGLADVAFEPADFLERSLEWAAEVVAGHRVVERPAVDRDAARWDAALDVARAAVDARVHGAAPAPYRALELLSGARRRQASPGASGVPQARGDRDAGFAAEDDALAELLLTEQFRAGVYGLDLVQRRARRPAGAPDAALARPVGRVGVVGAGLMASQLAVLFARRLRVPVVMTDVDDVRVQRGLGLVRAEAERLVARGRLSPAAAGHLVASVSGATSPTEAFAGADLVIEAVVEDLAVKQEVLRQVEAAVGDDCVLMTNTSSLSVSAMGSVLARPERLVGFHVFNPVAVLRLVEVVRAERTDDATLATAFAVGASLGKSCVLVRDAPAFVVNRLLVRLMSEVLGAVDEGTDPGVAESALAPLGFPMGTLALTDLVGPAVSLHVAQSLRAAFPDRFGELVWLTRVVAAGLTRVLRPAGAGAGSLAPALTGEAAALLPGGTSPSTAEQLRERALSALATEARLLLEEGVVADPRDVDLCLQLGAGWPAANGGLLPLLDRTGAAHQATGRRFLPAGVASLPAAPAP